MSISDAPAKTEGSATASSNQLRPNVLGAASIMFLVVSAAAPLTAVAGGVPLAMLLGNGAGVAGAVGIVTLILMLFAVGYVAMSRHVRNAGAFYAFAAQGLGGHFGGAAAMVAILSYNCMQIGILGHVPGDVECAAYAPDGQALVVVLHPGHDRQPGPMTVRVPEARIEPVRVLPVARGQRSVVRMNQGGKLASHNVGL